MAATGSVENAFTFVKGLVTEGGFFLHPKDAWKEGFNITPNVDGSIERRNGFNYEDLYSLFNINVNLAEQPNWAYVVEKWEAVNGEGALDYFVVQVGPIIYFYEAATGTTSVKRKAFTIDLNDFGFTGRDGLVGSSPIKVTSAYGKLIITNKDSEPILVVFNKSTDTISANKLELQIRDFDGIRSPVAPSIEYTQSQWAALNFWPHALYNLYNQGWTDAHINAYSAANGGKLPGNNKQWIYGKNTDDNFDVTVLAKQDFGTMVAPKGRTILKAFYQDRSAGLVNLVGTNTAGGVGSSFPAGNPNYDDTYVLPEVYEVP